MDVPYFSRNEIMLAGYATGALGLVGILPHIVVLCCSPTEAGRVTLLLVLPSRPIGMHVELREESNG
jgi:hypothetical protein